MHKKLWLSDHDMISWDFEKSKIVLFHIHGAVGSASNAQEIMKRQQLYIVDVFQVSPDLWTLPEGTKLAETLSVMTMQTAQKLWNLIAHNEWKKKIILHGNSYGWSLALLLSSHYSKDIDGLILNSSSWFGEALENEFWNIHNLFSSVTSLPELSEQHNRMKEIIAKLIQMKPSRIRDYMIDKALRLSFKFDKDAKRYHASNRLQFMRFWKILNFLSSKGNEQEYVNHEELLKIFVEKYHKPVLFIGWENDKVTPPEVIHHQAWLVWEQAIIIPDVWHSSHMEDPELFIKEVNNWMNNKRLVV